MDSIEKFIVAMTVLVFLILMSIGFILPYFEMKSFNSCTHSNATYKDALFMELRAFYCKK